MKYWAKRRNKMVGPCSSHQLALDLFRKTHPFKGEHYEARAKKNQIMTGYGELGPYSDLQWWDAR